MEWSVLEKGLTNPKVSVLVVTYNHERYIRSALEGVLAQETSFPFEIVVCDDASTDGTRSIVEEFAARYADCVRVWYREKNVGDWGAENFLLGLDACRGEYIATLDGDDYWIDPRKLQLQADFLDTQPEYALCFHGCRIEYEDSRRESWEARSPKERVTTEDILTAVVLQTSTMMMRQALARELLLDRRLPKLKDVFIGLVASRSSAVGYIDRVMSVYRQHASAVFASLNRARQKAELVSFCRETQEILGAACDDALERTMCIESYNAAMECEEEGDFASARRFLPHALESRPEWLEERFAGYGVSGRRLLRQARRRAWLYRVPPLLMLWRRCERVLFDLQWCFLSFTIRRRSRARFEGGRAVGFLLASPSPTPPSGRGAASIDLEWTSVAEAVEVRLGRPDGPLVGSTNYSGAMRTGAWVASGMLFYLQDTTADRPLALENTLDVVRITVR